MSVPDRSAAEIRGPQGDPFSADPAERSEYLLSYRRGHEAALMGRLSTWCFQKGPLAAARTTGWADGQGDGLVEWLDQVEAATQSRDRSRLTELIGSLDAVDATQEVDRLLGPN